MTKQGFGTVTYLFFNLALVLLTQSTVVLVLIHYIFVFGAKVIEELHELMRAGLHVHCVGGGGGGGR